MSAAAEIEILSAPRPRRRGRGRPSRLLVALALIPTLLILLPIFYVVFRSFNAGWSGIATELFRWRTAMLLRNTVYLTGSVTFFSVLIGFATAWAIERSDLPGAKYWRIACSLPLAMPAFVASFSWKSLGPEFQGMGGAILIMTMESFPLILLPVAATLRGMDPGMEEVSRSLGKSAWTTFRRVIVPRTLPALGGGALLVASHALSEFGALALLRVQTFTTAIFQQYQLEFDNSTAAVLSALLMLFCLPLAAGEIRLRHGRRFAKVGRATQRRATPARLGWTVWPVTAGFIALAFLSLGVPFGRLTFWLWKGVSAGRGLDAILPALAGSLSLALPGTLVTTLIALPLVLLAYRSRGRFARFADRLPYIVHGLPGLVVALSLVYISIRVAPFAYQSSALLFCAYAILLLPLAQSAIGASAEMVPAEMEEVARTLGSSPARAFITVMLPALAPGIGAALALVALELMRELTATLILAPAGVTTLATEVWQHTNDGAYAAAAPFAALLVVASGLPVYLFTLRALQPGGKA